MMGGLGSGAGGRQSRLLLLRWVSFVLAPFWRVEGVVVWFVWAMSQRQSLDLFWLFFLELEAFAKWLASALGSELHRYVIGVSRRHAFRLLTSTSNQTTTEILSNTAFCYLRSSFQTAGYHSIYQDHCRDLQDTPYHHDPRQGPRRQGICR
jgi:hypothetical protein